MDIEPLLRSVQKPARYIGGEFNSIKKPWDTGVIKICLSYPDVYEIGMSFLGLQILYRLLNSDDGALCERCFTPWPDMEHALRSSDTPLFSLESRMPLVSFDVVGFSLGYELTYTNVLTMLELGRIPLYSHERRETDPIVIAGGPSAVSPRSLARFIDVFFIGDAEESLPEFVREVRRLKAAHAGR
ncbi:MAG: B12-binding domain-containing radical SAM protein, partial [Candidatus Omnitrophica bacterium]|nr:B12-binding domain-containing radical SAM protein [Candidatus Omnitrophota bacterium]